MALTGGMPLRVNGEAVGAVGVTGLGKETDAELASNSCRQGLSKRNLTTLPTRADERF
jgi:uncharacterized protein GlcG (DUF336 family)